MIAVYEKTSTERFAPGLLASLTTGVGGRSVSASALNTSAECSSVPLSTMRAGSVGEELRALRLMRGLSQKDLAEAVGISAPQVSQMETGRYHPSLVMLDRILDVLDARLVIELNEGGLVDPSGSQRPPARPAP